MPTALLERPPAAFRPLADDVPLRITIYDRAQRELIHCDSQEALAALLWAAAYSQPKVRLLSGYSLVVTERRRRPHHENGPRGPRPRRGHA
jgi:hypothetical protein